MRAFLIFLVAAGASVYGFLVALHGLLPPPNSDHAAAFPVDEPARHRGSWGTYLPIPSTSQQSVASNAASERPGDSNRPQLSTRAENPSENLHESVQASEVVRSPETYGQGGVSSAPQHNVVFATTETSSPKAAPSKRKPRNRAAKPMPSDNAMLATYGPQSGRPTAGVQRRGLGFFLFGRFAARD
jgi:hypothetical protein